MNKRCRNALHDDKMCLLPNCRYHIILIGDVEELLQEIHALCFIYQHVDSLCTFSKCRFGDKNFVKSGQVFDIVQRAVIFNRRTKVVGRMPSIAEEKLLTKMYRKHLLSSFQKTNQSNLADQSLQENFNKLRSNKDLINELELIKL